MHIATTAWRYRISPVFDQYQILLVDEVDTRLEWEKFVMSDNEFDAFVDKLQDEVFTDAKNALGEKGFER